MLEYHTAIEVSGSVLTSHTSYLVQVKKKEMKDNSAVSGMSFYEDDMGRVIPLSYNRYPHRIRVSFKHTIREREIGHQVTGKGNGKKQYSWIYGPIEKFSGEITPPHYLEQVPSVLVVPRSIDFITTRKVIKL